MKSVKLTRHTGRTEVAFRGALDVGGIRAAHKTLDEALERAQPIDLRAADLERVDTAGLQLILTFLHTARERGLQSRWRSVSSALTGNAALLGLTAALELPE